MAVSSLTAAQVYVDDLDLTGYTNSVNVDMSVNELDATTFASSGWSEVKPGMKSGTFSYEGFFDADSTFSNPSKNTWDNIGVAGQPVSVCSSSPAAGDRCYIGGGLTSSFSQLGKIGELIPVSGSLSVTSGNAGIARGYVLWPKATVTASSGTAVQLGAVPSGSRLLVCLHVFTAGTSVTFKIQRDTVGFPSATDHITRTVDNVNDSEFIVDTTVTTDDYWRVNWSALTGTFVCAVTAAVIS